jgi:hypothetical protein
MKSVRGQNYALATFFPKEILLVFISVKRLCQPPGHGAARRIMSMKNSSNAIRNLTCDPLVCSAVPQPTAPPHAPAIQKYQKQTVIFLINRKSRKYMPLTAQFKNISPIKIN